MKSAIYEGRVFHSRLEPRPHAFQYGLYMMYLDLEELPQLFERRWLWSARAPACAWFRRADYMGPREKPLREAVLDRVEQSIGRRPDGAVRVLTHLRTFGYVFNPVTIYYCFDASDRLEAIAAEITNTPWRERHAYVLDARRSNGDLQLSWRFQKEFHVSPFHGMDVEYEWRLSSPGDDIVVHMTSLEGNRPVFHAGLALQRRPITARSLAGALVRHPLHTLRLHAAIYWQAARLFLKHAPFHEHPRNARAETEMRTT
jgi:DUF1365 family protein